MGERSVVGISASKVVALIGSLLLIADSVNLILTFNLLNIFFAILGFIGAGVIILSLKIVDIPKIDIPYEWWILLLVGGVLLVLYLLGTLATTLLTGTIVILIAAGVEIITEKKNYAASQLVAIIGAFLTILFSIMSMNVLTIIIGIICAVLLILAMLDSVPQIPFSWWVVLILGFVVFTWAEPIGGTVILIAFILMLMSY